MSLELIEKYGSGVRRVIDAFVAYGLPEPVFEATQGGMAVAVFNTTVNEGANKLAQFSTCVVRFGPWQFLDQVQRVSHHGHLYNLN